VVLRVGNQSTGIEGLDARFADFGQKPRQPKHRPTVTAAVTTNGTGGTSAGGISVGAALLKRTSRIIMTVLRPSSAPTIQAITQTTPPRKRDELPEALQLRDTRDPEQTQPLALL
jgi:hypothetical protein